MAVYVDQSIWKYGRMTMCHMIADTLDELFDMADNIGVHRKHYQDKSKYGHFDICKAKRARAVTMGAKEVTAKELVRILRNNDGRP